MARMLWDPETPRNPRSVHLLYAGLVVILLTMIWLPLIIAQVLLTASLTVAAGYHLTAWWRSR